MNMEATLEHVSQLIGEITYRLKPIITKLVGSNYQTSKRVKLCDLAMLDIVHYFNEVNCIPHYDLGFHM
jgi:hypothetical protein